jgi:tetratricopeptide (TPR) repeat protein
LVDGDFKDLFRLQAELAKQVAIAIQGPMKEADLKAFEAGMATGPTLQAFEAFSDRLYFLRKDLARDALSKFDLTLALDPTYAGAYHYRGVALAAMNRLDEAIDAFKRALPRSDPERLALWTWEAPFGPQPGIHGVIRGMDSIQTHLQRDLFAGRKAVPVQKRIIYGERAENSSTVLHFSIWRDRSCGASRSAIPISFSTRRLRRTILHCLAFCRASTGPLPAKSVCMHFGGRNPVVAQRVADFGRDLPRVALIGDAFSSIVGIAAVRSSQCAHRRLVVEAGEFAN